jgi:sulfate transport system substrate-binding protein
MTWLIAFATLRAASQTRRVAGLFLALGFGWAASMPAGAATETLLNVSYDLSREFYQDFNPVFAADWKSRTGDAVVINQSHGGSSKQAQSVLNGLEADVVTMNQSPDIDLLLKGHLVASHWSARLPNHSVPFTSTIVFVVRAGNPHGVHTWEDLVKPGVSLVIPNPKTSGNGRYSYLAAWGHALRSSGGDAAAARRFVAQLLGRVPVLDTGGRGATITFADHGIGDVLLTFENEAAEVKKLFPQDALEVVVPPDSIVAENPVAWVDRNVVRHHTEAVARAYLEFLYTEAGQEIAAQHYLRPKAQAARDKYPGRFPALELFTVAEVAGDWAQAQQTHFADGAMFDQIMSARSQD